MQYDYYVVTKGMSMFDSIEDFGQALQKMLNQDANAHAELGWELWQVQMVSSSEGGNNGFVFVYRRPKP